MSRSAEFSARLVGGRVQGRTIVGKLVHRGTVAIDGDRMGWKPGALSRAFFMREPIEFDEVLHIQIIESFWGGVTFFPNAGVGPLIGFHARGSVLASALEGAGYTSTSNSNWPGVSVAVPDGRRPIWTSEGPRSELAGTTS